MLYWARIGYKVRVKDISINCEIERDGGKIYKSGPIKSGEEYMSHSLSNMEYHHFKYDIHRLPGDLHLHYFGTSQLSYSTRDWKFNTGDKIIISSNEYEGSLKNEVKKVNSKDFNKNVKKNDQMQTNVIIHQDRIMAYLE